MKKFKSALIVLTCSLLFLCQKSYAVELGVIGGYQSGGVNSDSSTVSYSNGSAYEFGGLLLFSVFPFVQVRTGVISKTRKIDGTFAGVTETVTDSVLDIPINLQVSLPLRFYVYGGVIYSATQSTNCSVGGGSSCFTSGKTPDDLPLNLGVGFNFVEVALFSFGIEGEYQLGTKNLDSTGNSNLKSHSVGINAVAKFGF